MPGLGVDVVDIARMRRALERTPRMKERVFSEGERWYAEQKSMPEVHYALRFAAKEAVWKALGTGFSGYKFSELEIDRDEKGRPIAVLSGATKAYAESIGVSSIELSLSYTKSTAVASALAITEDIIPVVEDNPLTQKEELARQFKELRSMLDEELVALESAREEES